MTWSLRPDLHRTHLKLDSLAPGSVVIDAHGDAWQLDHLGIYWYRAFDGEGRSSFEVAQIAERVEAARAVS